MPIIEVTAETNRLDLWAAANIGSKSDEARFAVIYNNLPYFLHTRTFWLGLGDYLSTDPPVYNEFDRLVVNGGYLVINNRRLSVRGEAP